jgi:hypothetical protein
MESRDAAASPIALAIWLIAPRPTADAGDPKMRCIDNILVRSRRAFANHTDKTAWFKYKRF